MVTKLQQLQRELGTIYRLVSTCTNALAATLPLSTRSPEVFDLWPERALQWMGPM